MNTNSLCPSCRNPIPADAPGGICPACALMGVAQPTLVMPFAGAPAREQVAAAFPDLEVLEVLGQGGMGIVFKARQPRLDRLVALKILPPVLAEQPGFAERFTREARALAKLNHPNIVTVHDFGTNGGFFYLLMEYVNGVNLRKAMQAGIKPEQAMLLVPRICEALQFAHDHGVLHRDIKPENILLDTYGTPKLADFGIAKLAGENGSGLTLSGAALGTAAYMAPEQIEKPATVDHRADIYSLGVVFYEMLTGELPLGRFASPSEKSNVGESVDRVVLRALEKERDRRQQSATEMKTQVEGVRDGRAPVMPRMEKEPRGDSPVKHFLRILTVLCAIGIPASAVFRLSVFSPAEMVFITAAVAVLAGMWPSAPGRSRGRRGDRVHAASMDRGFESRSRRTLFGLPLYHIVRGYNPDTGVIPVARGIFAMGQVAKGFFAMGGRAHGVFAIGGMATGVVTLGGISIGIFSIGGLAVGLLCAVGGMAVGSLVFGGGMAGLAYLGGAPAAHLWKGRMMLGPLVDPAGELPMMLGRIALMTGAFTVGLSLIVLFLTAFAQEGEPRPHNPWPRRLFLLMFLACAIPAFALFVPAWRARTTTRGQDMIHWKQTTVSTDGSHSQALWQATSAGPAWLTVDAGTGPQSIDLRKIRSAGGCEATLGLTVEGNKPEPGWMKVTCNAQNWHREINSSGYFRMPPGITAGNIMTLSDTDVWVPLSTNATVPILKPESGAFTVTLSRKPPVPPEDTVSVRLRNVLDPQLNPGDEITIEHTEFTRGDCVTYFRTIGTQEPDHRKTTQAYAGEFLDGHRNTWNLPRKADETARISAVESVKKAIPSGSIKLNPGQEIRILSLPVPNEPPVEIFLGARYSSSRNVDAEAPSDAPAPVSR